MKEIRKLIYQDLINGELSIDEADEELQVIFKQEEVVRKDKFKRILHAAKREWRFGSQKEAIRMVLKASGMRLKRCKEFCEAKF